MLLFLLPLKFFSLHSCSCSNYFWPSVTAQHAVDTSAWSFVAVFSLVIVLCLCCSCSFGGLFSSANRSHPLSDFANVALRALLFFLRIRVSYGCNCSILILSLIMFHLLLLSFPSTTSPAVVSFESLSDSPAAAPYVLAPSTGLMCSRVFSFSAFCL